MVAGLVGNSTVALIVIMELSAVLALLFTLVVEYFLEEIIFEDSTMNEADAPVSIMAGTFCSPIINEAITKLEQDPRQVMTSGVSSLPPS